MKREHSAGIIIYRVTKEGPKFLLLYSGGDYWNFPKGKLEENERSFRAALREVQEETGLRPIDLQFKDWFRVEDRFTYTRNREKIYKTVMYYLAETRNPYVRIKIVSEGHQGERHEGYAWFLVRDALRVVKAPNLQKHLRYISDVILHKRLRPASVTVARTGSRPVGNKRRRTPFFPFRRNDGSMQVQDTKQNPAS